MLKVYEAREIANSWVEPTINIEDIMKVIEGAILNAASGGKYKIKVTVDPEFVRKAKEQLKELGYVVSVFHSNQFDYRNGLTTGSLSGDIEISWK
jgi:hypothetical protein